MLIRKITLRNFRNFKNATIDFSVDEDKKFTIILGKNTSGKTTLVRSFVWCLYRVNLFDDPILLNSDVADSLLPGEEISTEVILELDHKGFSYKITTKEFYRRKDDKIIVSRSAYTNIVKVNSGVSEIIDPRNINEEIDSILQKELREYFFFEGEKNSIDKVTTTKNLKAAVTNILGLNSFEELRDYFNPDNKNTVISILQNELTSTDQIELSKAQIRLEDLKESKQTYEDEIEEAKNEIDNLTLQKDDKEAILDANKDIKEDQILKKTLEHQIPNRYNLKEEKFNLFIKLLNKGDSLIKVLIAKAYVKYNLHDIKLHTSFQKENSYQYINEQAVDDLIKAHRCICGAEIQDGNEAYRNLVEAKKHMEPNDYGKYIETFDSAEIHNVYASNNTLIDTMRVLDETLTLIENIDVDEKQLYGLKKKLENRPDIGEIQAEVNNLEASINIQNGIIKNNNEKHIPNVEMKISKLSDEIEKLSQDSENNVLIKECISYGKEIYKNACKKIEDGQIKIKTSLQNVVSDIFKEMYHGNRVIKIDDNFNVHAEVPGKKTDKDLDKSTGLKTVINYSFVTGLMNLAKQNILMDDSVISDDENINDVYPLVMDAPFSNTDDIHIQNICKALPKYCNQIIMFVMDSHYESASDVIEDQVGKKYKLDKHSETECEVKEDY